MCVCDTPWENLMFDGGGGGGGGEMLYFCYIFSMA